MRCFLAQKTQGFSRSILFTWKYKSHNSTNLAGQSRVPKSNNTMAGSLKQTMNKKGFFLFMPNFSGKQIIWHTNLEEVRNLAADNISNIFNYHIEIVFCNDPLPAYLFQFVAIDFETKGNTFYHCICNILNHSEINSGRLI